MNREMVKEKRHTTVHDRFQVSCSCCGYMESFSSLTKAWESAQLRKLRHNQPGEKIEICDIMAHIGCTDLWDADGNPLNRRKA